MQDSSRPVNPFLKTAPPTGANVVDSSTAPLERPSPPLLSKRRLPSDVAGIFIVITAVLVSFNLLVRTKLHHGDNDGSRWNTVYYLVTHGTYEYKPDWKLEGVRIDGRGGTATEDQWKAMTQDEQQNWMRIGERYYRRPWTMPPFPSVDMICVKDEQGNPHYYSSKPPLLSTCVAGVVIALEKVAPPVVRAVNGVYGAIVSSSTESRPADTQPAATASRQMLPDISDFAHTPRFYMRAAVLLLQVIPLLILIWVIRQHVVEHTDSPWVQNLCIAAAALATYLTAYVVPLNNHVVAACCAMFALHAGIRIWNDGRREWYWFLLAGLFGGLCHTLELPATALTVVLFAALLYKAPRRTLVICLPAMLIPIAASFYTTWLVTGSVMPIPSRFDEVGGPFFYEGSYWHANGHWVNDGWGIDALREPKQTYLYHLIVGHHGFFSLTPLFILGLIGMGRHLVGQRIGWALIVTVLLAALVVSVAVVSHLDAASGSVEWPSAASPESLWAKLARWGTCIKLAVTHPAEAAREGAGLLWGRGFLAMIGMLLVVNLGMYLGGPDRRRPLLAAATLLLLLILLVFYTFTTNNYAGSSQGARWLFWTIPLWLLMLPAGIEVLAEWRLGRWLCYLCFLVSLLTVVWGFPRPQEDVRATDRPFTSSWLHDYYRAQGYIDY